MGSVYNDYEIYKRSYYAMQNIINELLTEKERIFNMTQPNAIRYDKENVEGGKLMNGFDAYMAKLEESKIDERLREAKQLLFERERLLLIKEKELRASKDINDIVYVMKYLDNCKPRTIANALAYSESQIYRILEKIKKGVE